MGSGMSCDPMQHQGQVKVTGPQKLKILRFS